MMLVEHDLSVFQATRFKDVTEIRKKVDDFFAPQNVKMICKRAERVYSNSY